METCKKCLKGIDKFHYLYFGFRDLCPNCELKRLKKKDPKLKCLLELLN